MPSYRQVLINAFFCLLVFCSPSHGADNVIFKDDFSRADSETVGNGWITNGAASLKGKGTPLSIG